jgi:hypothetical protein
MMATTRQLISRLREGAYTNPDGSQVMYTDKDTLRQLYDLYAILPEQGPSGSSNLPNDQVRTMLSDIQNGQPLSDAQLGALRGLLAKYKSELAAFVASGRSGQDYGDVVAPGTGRLIPAPANSQQRDHHGRFRSAQ